MREFLFFYYRHNARRSVRRCVYVLLADKQTFREKGRGQCEKKCADTGKALGGVVTIQQIIRFRGVS